MGCHGGRGRLRAAGGNGNRGVPDVTYDKLPFSTLYYGGKYATNDEKKAKRDTVKSFIKNAQAGDIYQLGTGFGSKSPKIEIVRYNRSPNKLGIKSGGRTVALSTTNVTEYLTNGAKLIARKR